MTKKQSDFLTKLQGLLETAPTVQVTRNKFGYQVDGEKFRRVTTLLNGIPKDALYFWGKKVVAEFAWEHQDVWTGLTKEDAIKLLKGSPESQKEKAGVRGTAVHDALEALVLGRPLPEDLNEEELHLVGGATAFLNQRKSKILASEMIVFNRTEGYCGTLDLWDIDADGTPWILDYKTSKNVYPNHAVQQVAYQRAEFAIVQMKKVPGKGKTEAWEGKLIPWSQEYCQRLGVIHVEPSRTTLYEVADADRLWRVFRASAYIKDWLLATNSFAGKTPREETYLEPITFEEGDNDGQG